MHSSQKSNSTKKCITLSIPLFHYYFYLLSHYLTSFCNRGVNGTWSSLTNTFLAYFATLQLNSYNCAQNESAPQMNESQKDPIQLFQWLGKMLYNWPPEERVTIKNEWFSAEFCSTILINSMESVAIID